MEGNQCKAVLQRAGELLEVLPDHLKNFASTLTTFNTVRNACFGKYLLPNYKDEITSFHKEYLKLNLSVTPKVHALICHVPQYCDNTGMGLGISSEQASEAVHADFKRVWERYCLPPNHPRHGDQLLRAAVKYNGLHI